MPTKFKTMKDLAKRIEDERPDILDAMEETELEHLVSRQIREFRKKENISQIKLKEKASLTQCQISRIERGKIGNFSNLKKILDALDLEIKLVRKKKSNDSFSSNVKIKTKRKSGSKTAALKSKN